MELPVQLIAIISEEDVDTVQEMVRPVSYTHLAGRKRHMGIRPTVRGSVMNPNDHPHGGGEGKTGIGRPGPFFNERAILNLLFDCFTVSSSYDKFIRLFVFLSCL